MEYPTLQTTSLPAQAPHRRTHTTVASMRFYGAKDRISFTIYWVPQSASTLNGGARAYNFFHHSQINEAFSGIWNHTFSPTFLNEARANAAGWRWNEIASNPQSPVGLPTDHIGQIGSLGANGQNFITPFGPNVGSILNQWTYSYKDVATKIAGSNTIKFGGELTRLYYLNECAGCGVPNYTFFNMWDFLNDAPNVEKGSFDPNTGIPTTIRQDDREDIWGLFVQDDFKASTESDRQSRPALVLLWSALFQTGQHVCGHARRGFELPDGPDRSEEAIPGTRRRLTSDLRSGLPGVRINLTTNS